MTRTALFGSDHDTNAGTVTVGEVLVGVLLVPVFYLLGTFPSAVMVGRAKGIDITKVGSGNPGASNVARVLGTTWGAVVFLLDALKGAIPAAIGLLAGSRPLSYAWVAAAIVGHMFPITRRFVGGKGAATFGGSILVLFPALGAILLVTWILLRKLTGKASLATLAILAGLIIGVAVRGTPGWEIAAVAAISAVVLLRHFDNIKRLIGGRELAASRR